MIHAKIVRSVESYLNQKMHIPFEICFEEKILFFCVCVLSFKSGSKSWKEKKKVLKGNNSYRIP